MSVYDFYTRESDGWGGYSMATREKASKLGWWNSPESQLFRKPRQEIQPVRHSKTWSPKSKPQKKAANSPQMHKLSQCHLLLRWSLQETVTDLKQQNGAALSLTQLQSLVQLSLELSKPQSHVFPLQLLFSLTEHLKWRVFLSILSARGCVCHFQRDLYI